MESIRTLIVDDEPLALDLLESYVKRTPFLTLCGRASSAFQAMEFMKDQTVDLILLDIQMPGLTGTDFARSLRFSPKIIFSTAFPEYAIEGFKLDAVDYLLKPYDYSEFLRAVQKVQSLLVHITPNETLDYFFVKSEYRLIRIDVERILYVEGMKDYIKIHLQGESKPILTLMSLKGIMEKLPAQSFQRVHRSFIIHMRHVTLIEKGFAIIGNVQVPIAEKYREMLDDL